MTTKERFDKHEKQIAAIRDLVKSGMQMVIATREDIRETREDIRDTRKDLRALAASQKRTEASLKAFIDQMRRSGGNGHAKGKIDLQ